METNGQEIQRRMTAALAAIRNSATDDDSSVALFISHHLEELEPAYWQEHAGTEQPDGIRVLELLQFRSHWSPGDKSDGLDVFDFTLPGRVTDYVLSVSFDEQGRVEGIEMES